MAGLLGQIFSAGNVAKRQLRDLLGNPVLSAQQMAGNLNDRARNLNEMTSAAAREGMDYGPATQRLAGLMAEGYNPMGLTVYHGSPYKFNKFDSSKIGTGEGTAAYGRGLYVAQAPETARSYQAMANNPTARRQQKNRPEEVTLDAIIMTNAKQFAEGDVNKLADVIKRKPAAFSYPEKLLQRIEQYEDNRPPSFFYEIDLPDEQIAKMISYENPVPADVRERLSAAAMEKFGTGVTDTSGELLYKELTQQFKFAGSKTPEADASEFLRSQGIPGMSHLDAGSRTRTQGEGTQNFVVFPGNEDLLTILRRNGGLLD
jgi:hypothetical protein